MTDSAPPHAGNGAPPIAEEAVILAREIVAAIDGCDAMTAVIALLLALAEIIVDTTDAHEDARLRTLVDEQLAICITRLRELPPLE